LNHPATEVGHKPDGVYFAPADYAGLMRRTLSGAIDVAVLALAWVAIALAVAWLYALRRTPASPTGPAILLWLLFLYAYIAVLKATPVGTLGYLITRTRIVDLRGRRPSLARTSLRALLLVGFPLHPVLDLIWLGGDSRRQKFADKAAGTYVVKRSAVPVGRGEFVPGYYDFCGPFWIFWEVKGPAPT
jgi:uncharacterized RDD family membrane protein YckC